MEIVIPGRVEDASPEAITTIGSMDSGPAPSGASRNDEVVSLRARQLIRPPGNPQLAAMRKLPVVLICRRPLVLPLPPNQRQISRRPVLDKEGRFAVVTNVG